MGIKPGELGGHTVPGLKSSYQGEPVEGEVRKAGKARLLSSLQDEDRSLDSILIIWETTNGFYRWYEIYVTKIILATAKDHYSQDMRQA